MSDCGVCLSGGDSGSSTEFIHTQMRKARKPHHCSECGNAIAKGETYEWSSGKSDGDLWSFHTCAPCAEIAEAFYCDGRWFGGMLWEQMDDVFGGIGMGCLAKLQTARAKAFLLERWQEWKGLPRAMPCSPSQPQATAADIK